jgi:SAM-dependent methyltransferase
MGKKKTRTIQYQSNSQKTYSGTEELLGLEESLPGYNNDVVRKLGTGLGVRVNEKGPTQKVLEFGAGTGALAEIWRSQFSIKPVCIEIDPVLIQILRSKGFETHENVIDLSSEFDLVYTSNVLEHIEDDVSALVTIRKKMKQGGKIAIYVPALPMLYSDFDRKIGHFRRYRKKELQDKVKLAGFDIEKCYYSDCVGVLAWLTLRILRYQNSKSIGTEKSLLFYDKYLYPVSRVLDRLIFRHLIGKNLFLFAVNRSS